MSDLEDMRAGNVTIHAQYPWPYFHHFPLPSIPSVWDLLDAQGEGRTWWLGASACFESVNDVLGYNLIVLEEAGLRARGCEEGGGGKNLRGAREETVEAAM